MAINFECECGKLFSVADAYAGQETRCPQCGRTVRVSSSSTTAETKVYPEAAAHPQSAIQLQKRPKRYLSGIGLFVAAGVLLAVAAVAVLVGLHIGRRAGLKTSGLQVHGYYTGKSLPGVGYGDKLTLSGNIDIAGPLAFGTPEEVREEVRQHMEKLKPGGRYIMSTNHSVMDDVPPENYRAMLDAGLEFGVY